MHLPLSSSRNSARLSFAAAAVMIYTAIFLITRTHHAGIVNVAAAFDLTITTSAVFYFLLVRRGHANWLTLATVALAGLRASMFLLPDAPQMKWLAAPLELLLLASVIRRVRQIEGDDALTRIRTATRAAVSNARIAQILAAEIAVVYYALFSWRARPEPGFSSAQTSGYSLFGTLLIFGMVFEGIPLHLIVMRYSPAVAWTLTALDLYGLLWATAILRANTLRATQLDAEYLRVRIGLIWEVNIPRKDIMLIRRFEPTDKPDLKAVFLNTPQFLIELTNPTEAIGLYGNRRNVTTLGLSFDRPEEFAAALARVEYLCRS
jgi:hypothetical protein